jgi:putative methyltransferase
MNSQSQRKNLTRRSRSIPRRLLREGALHLVPVYYLLRLSDLGREGIEHSGSFRFADHIYRGTPSGRTAAGTWIDARLLAMPAAQAFRRRYEQAQHVVRRALESYPSAVDPLRVLAVPCGIPRDIMDLGTTLRAENPGLLARLEYHGLDIDPEVLDVAGGLTRDCGLASVHYHLGNALIPGDYPASRFHVVVSTGLGEFLSDDELAAFYTLVYGVMEPGGTFYTSATSRDQRSDALLRMVELVTHYRRTGEVEQILRQLPWSRLVVTRDSTGLQTFITAIK